MTAPNKWSQFTANQLLRLAMLHYQLPEEALLKYTTPELIEFIEKHQPIKEREYAK